MQHDASSVPVMLEAKWCIPSSAHCTAHAPTCAAQPSQGGRSPLTPAVSVVSLSVGDRQRGLPRGTVKSLAVVFQPPSGRSNRLRPPANYRQFCCVSTCPQVKNKIPAPQYVSVLRTMLCMDGDPKQEHPECAACAACLGFKFSARGAPPEACDKCYVCVAGAVFGSRGFLDNREFASDCDRVVNESTIAVGPNEHRCHPFKALTAHVKDLLPAEAPRP